MLPSEHGAAQVLRLGQEVCVWGRGFPLQRAEAEAKGSAARTVTEASPWTGAGAPTATLNISWWRWLNHVRVGALGSGKLRWPSR